MKQVVASIGFIMAFAAFGNAQVSQIISGQRLTDDSGGYSFSAPSGWKSSKSEGGFTLANPANTVVIFVKPHNYETFAAAVKDMNLNDNSRVLGEPQNLQNGGRSVRIAQTTAKGVAVIDLFVLFSPSGGGAVVIAMTDTVNADASFTAGLKVSEGVTFVKRERSDTAASPWQAALAGKHLLYLYSGNGYFEEKHIYLCSSGVFLQKTGSGGFSPGDADGGSFAGKGGTRGKWGITGSTLVMQFPDGSVGQYAISRRQAGNEVGLNGKRYFVQSQDVCR